MAENTYWARRQVCVTGGSGFLGYHLVRQLRDAGAFVRVFALPPGKEHPLRHQADIETIYGDIRDASLAQRATAGCDTIFHTAGTVAVWGPALVRMQSIHVDGTRTILRVAPRSARIVHTSSIVAVGAILAGKPLSEASVFNLERLRVEYVHAKRDAETVALAAAASGQDVVVTNPGYLLGPDDYERSVMGRLCVRAWKGRIPVAPPGGFCLADVRDVAAGHLLAAQHGQRGQRYILGGENRSFAEFITLLHEIRARPSRRIPTLPAWVFQLLATGSEIESRFTGKEPYPSFQHVQMNRFRWFCHSDKARAELCYAPRPLVDTLLDTYRWYVRQGILSARHDGPHGSHPGQPLPASATVTSSLREHERRLPPPPHACYTDQHR